MDQQTQQIANTTSNISDTTNNVTNNVNEYQQTNKAILDKSIETSNKYQQEVINTIQSITNNTIEFQKNFANIIQSVFSKFIDMIHPNLIGTIISIPNDIQMCIIRLTNTLLILQ